MGTFAGRCALGTLLRDFQSAPASASFAANTARYPPRDRFLYLVAVMDWVSRYVLTWRLSNLLDSSFCVEDLQDALSKGRPEIFNSDFQIQSNSRVRGYFHGDAVSQR